MRKIDKKLWFIFEGVCYSLTRDGWVWIYGERKRCFQKTLKSGHYDEIFVQVEPERIIIRPNCWAEEWDNG